MQKLTMLWLVVALSAAAFVTSQEAQPRLTEKPISLLSKGELGDADYEPRHLAGYFKVILSLGYHAKAHLVMPYLHVAKRAIMLSAA